jgi:hypothetical protein
LEKSALGYIARWLQDRSSDSSTPECVIISDASVITSSKLGFIGSITVFPDHAIFAASRHPQDKGEITAMEGMAMNNALSHPEVKNCTTKHCFMDYKASTLCYQKENLVGTQFAHPKEIKATALRNSVAALHSFVDGNLLHSVRGAHDNYHEVKPVIPVQKGEELHPTLLITDRANLLKRATTPQGNILVSPTIPQRLAAGEFPDSVKTSLRGGVQICPSFNHENALENWAVSEPTVYFMESRGRFARVKYDGQKIAVQFGDSATDDAAKKLQASKTINVGNIKIPHNDTKEAFGHFKGLFSKLVNCPNHTHGELEAEIADIKPARDIPQSLGRKFR